MRFLIVFLFVSLLGTPAFADGALLARLAPNVEAPAVPRPTAPDAVAGLLLQGIGGQAGRITTFGHVFRQGDWPQGRGLIALANGAPVQMQTDIKARHPDGSVRHAILSLLNPQARGNLPLELHLGPAQQRGVPFDMRSVVPRGYNLALTFDFGGPKVTLDGATLLRQGIASEPSRWLQGPLVSELRVKRRLTPQLTAIIDIRGGVDGSVRTNVSVHNDAMFDTNNMDISYSYSIVMSGQTLVSESIKHRRYSNWREVVWAGSEPSAVHVVYDYPYMIAAGAVPAYDPELPLDTPAYAKSINAILKADTGPMGNALITKAMPTTGGRGDIGMLPDWTMAWLRTQSPDSRFAMIETADAAGSVPWHLRDPKTQRAPTLDAHPKYWMDYRASPGNNGHPPVKTRVDGWKIDNAHQPDLAYVPYLITGDRYYLDELLAQVAAGLFQYDPNFRGDAAGNLRNDEVRGQAWVNRTHGYAAWITPDRHPEKRYLTNKLRERLTWYATEYPRNDKLGGPVRYETAGWIQGANPKGIVSNWQQDFFAQSIGQIQRMGFAEAGSVYQYTRRYQLSRFLRNDFNPLWGTGYHTIHGDRDTRAPFATWQEISQANLVDGRFDSPPAVQNGDHDKAWNFAAQGRAGYASAVGAYRDPLMAEAYATLVRATIAMQSGSDDFSRHPKWGIVPVFPDGTTLALSRHRAVDGRADGDASNDLMVGGDGQDAVVGLGGNDILVGLGGDDLLAGGSGQNLMAGGRGNDRIIFEGGEDVAAGGQGADAFFIGVRAAGGPAPVGSIEITDYRPGTDQLVFGDHLGDVRNILNAARDNAGSTVLRVGGGQVVLRGVRARDLRSTLLAGQ